MKAALFALLFAVPLAQAMWLDLPLEKLLADSDCVVVASLSDVKEWSDDKTDFGTGVLTVDEVLYGRLPEAGRFPLRWQNPTGLICPRVVHEDTGGNRCLWLLKRGKDGSVTASHPSRVRPLSDRPEVERLLKTR